MERLKDEEEDTMEFTSPMKFIYMWDNPHC